MVEDRIHAIRPLPETGFLRSLWHQSEIFRKKPGFFSPHDRASPRAQKPGFYDHFGIKARYLGRNPVSLSKPYRAFPRAQKPGFYDHFGIKARYLGRNPVSLSKPYRAPNPLSLCNLNGARGLILCGGTSP